MLNELDKSFLQRIAEEEGMCIALSKHLKFSIQDVLIDTRATDTDELIGQKYRAYETAKNLISKALIDLSQFKGREKIKSNNLER